MEKKYECYLVGDKTDNGVWKELSYVLNVDSSIISNWYHGLINPRGILKNCMLVQSIPVD